MVDDQAEDTNGKMSTALYLSCCRLLVVMYIVHARLSCSSMLRKPTPAIDYAALTSWTFFIAVPFFVCS